MAANRIFADARKTRELTVPSGWVSGRPVASGQIPGVCLIDRASDGKATVQLDGVFNLAVQGKDSSGTSGADASVAVAEGDILYYDETPTLATYYLSKRAGGIRFGYALEAVSSGAAATIRVQVGY